MNSPQWSRLNEINLSKINSGCCYLNETFRTPYGDETIYLRYREHWRLYWDSYYFYVYDLKVTNFLQEELKKLQEEEERNRIPESTAMKCNSCSRVIEIGNNTSVCGICDQEAKRREKVISFESYFSYSRY
jgi:hypothetical protein